MSFLNAALMLPSFPCREDGFKSVEGVQDICLTYIAAFSGRIFSLLALIQF